MNVACVIHNNNLNTNPSFWSFVNERRKSNLFLSSTSYDELNLDFFFF